MTHQTHQRHASRLHVTIALAACVLSACVGLRPAHAEDASGRSVIIARIEGEIDPVMANYVDHVLRTAEDEHAPTLVITIDTPGGLDTSMRQIVQALLNSTVPTVAYIGPSGARAASAGVFIAEAANILAMAPGTNIGAAHPIQDDGQNIGSDLRDKITNDAAAYAASIARQRGRNDVWVQEAVRQSSSLDAQSAAQMHVADLIAPDLDTLLRDIDGRTVTTSSGATVVQSAGAPTTTLDMDLAESIAHRLFDPNVAYVALLVGLLAILMEFIHPGALVPGITGLVCLVLAFVASTALPMNWGGVLLIIVSAGLFVLDVKAATHGALTVAGLICLVLGSLLMYSPIGARSPTLPDVSLSPIALAGVTAVAAVAGGALAVAAVRVHRHQPLVGSQRLIGAFGITRTTLDPDGSVRVGGQLWSAHARSGRLEVDSPVRVLARRGLTLEVERLDPKSVREQKETTT